MKDYNWKDRLEELLWDIGAYIFDTKLGYLIFVLGMVSIIAGLISWILPFGEFIPIMIGAIALAIPAAIMNKELDRWY